MCAAFDDLLFFTGLVCVHLKSADKINDNAVARFTDVKELLTLKHNEAHAQYRCCELTKTTRRRQIRNPTKVDFILFLS